MRWSRQYAFKMLIFQSILTGEDMFGYSLSITCGDGSIDVKGTEVNSVNSLKIKHFRTFGQPSAGCLDTRIFLLWEYINRLNRRLS